MSSGDGRAAIRALCALLLMTSCVAFDAGAYMRPIALAARLRTPPWLRAEPQSGRRKERTMSVTPERKAAMVTQFKTHESDTGSPEVQVALLSERIT